ncbi:N-carbamoyl-L-amino-acid hydrolase [Mesocricetibacter intestinalis]|uniref:N-carbamoyl-L-amino-acid hydrolase n=1 Tax=Mesocricetibacter intestinalis TaxID=1521930 RepID=A0A4V3D9X5_9PAST|nr:Zn-dependent hydrolase [Mesocricetibacter intestinalis]TDQ59042.1 N-carbamoyl-L-amino-acid hydrolase [Mesocricetibacter intestinalis]
MLTINERRLKELLNRFADFGRTPNNGVTRLALSDEDKQARDYFVQLAEQAGFGVTIDAIGNIFVRRAGENPQAEPILVGSHGDSQPLGGRFDGIYGVLAGLEALLSFNDQQVKTQRPIDLVMWTNEEGARFAPAMMGAAVFAQKLPLSQALAARDSQGLSVGDELRRIGYAGNADLSRYQAHCAVEIHIEQGPILEMHQKDIGIVSGALGQNWYQIRFDGVASHAGTTPMDMRKDASLGMARAMLALNQLGRREIPHQGRVTVGCVQLTPNSPNVIPGSAYFTLEVRHPDKQALARIDQEIRCCLQTIAAEEKLKLSIKSVLALDPLHFNPDCLNLMEQVCRQLGYSYEHIVSGAGHDSCQLNDRFPTAMLFIPCIDGLSHNEAEDIRPEWSAAGAEVLANTLFELANRP